jgi:hypothetical protein
MGLGIYIKGEVSKPLFSFRKEAFQFSAIQDYITSYSSGLFKEFLSFSEDENTLYVTLHPSEEPVYFTRSENVIVCSAKTNSVGPGYHAYLVELIEKLGKNLKIEWQWDLEEGEEFYQDETGYYEHRNYEQLQLEMLRWLRALCRSYDEDESKQIMVSLPAGIPRLRLDYFAISPVGMWSKEWFNKVGSLEPEDIRWAGDEFFIWWNKEMDAKFYKQTGIALLNVDCPWHIPIDDKEKKSLAMSDQCFEQARKIDPFIELPEEDWVTVKNLLAEADTEIPETEYGYRKHLMTFDLAGDWLIDLPGTMYESTDESTLVHYDHIRTVRSLAYTISNKEKTDAEFAETFFDNNKNVIIETLYSEADLEGKAIIFYSIDKDLESEYWTLQGVKVKDHRFLLSTICYPTEDHKEWAIQTWRSIRR